MIFFVIAAVLILWQLLSVSGLVSPILVPSLFSIGKALVRDTLSGLLPAQLLFSLLLVALGALIGTAGAALLAFLASLGKRARQGVGLLNALLHPLPGIALLPLVVLWAGTGTPAVLLVMVHSALWPVYLNLQSGIDEISPRYREMAANWEMTMAQRLFHLVLPAIFPSLLSGLKTAWARCWRALIAAEMVFGAAGFLGGLGWYIFERRVYMDTAGLYAGLLLVMLSGAAVDRFLFGSLRRFTDCRWGKVEG